MPQDTDQQWDPVGMGDEDQEEDAQLGWDASDNPTQSMNMRSIVARQNTQDDAGSGAMASTPGFEPTQKLSDVRKFGLFGD